MQSVFTTMADLAFGTYFFMAFFFGFRPRLNGKFIFPVYSGAACMVWAVAMTLIGLTRLLSHSDVQLERRVCMVVLPALMLTLAYDGIRFYRDRYRRDTGAR